MYVGNKEKGEFSKTGRDEGIEVQGTTGDKKKRKKGGKGNGDASAEIKVIFWNVAGLKKKDREFWEYIEGFDIIGLCETWVEEKEWEKIKKNMSKKFVWKCQFAIREKGKGRAKGGIMTGVRKEIEEIDIKEVESVNGMQERKLRSSIRRMETILKYPPVECRQNVIDILSDQTSKDYRIYQEFGSNDDEIKTIATGIFDCIERTWSIYTDIPQINEPILVIPMQLRNFAVPQYNKAKK
ncbi:hypothetical protein DBV15_12603 [Temnothorax longispinosus]|uniref:Peptidase C45 hydrolase domain-containing protein n=1 Tax=Temnothorax longispinosus TaxID=300112 RepID=A0A4S2KWV6_9HYME|nr:hypothetical protein DBV15_12603 [Temnothorax longispinosus]